MKKIIGLVVAMAVSFMAFAEIHVATGLRGSILGLEPTVAVCVDDFEAEIGAAMSRNVSAMPIFSIDGRGDNMVLTPNITVGWNYDAFESGWHNTVGFSYFCPLLIESNSTTPAHMAGLSYRGSFKFRNNLEFTLTSYLPFILLNQSEDNPVIFTIVDQGGIWDSFLYGLMMTSVGMRINF